MSVPKYHHVRGFYFWSLSPFLVAFIVLMPFLIQNRNAGAILSFAAIEILAILVLLGLFNQLRFWWAWRGVGGIIFLGYLAYLVDTLIESSGSVTITPRKSEESAFNAIWA